MLLRAITTPPEASPPPGVHAFPVNGVTVWTSEVTGPFTKEDLLEHHRLVSEIFARVDACLPMRFPTVVDDLSTVDVEKFAAQLERVRDACELAITGVWRDATPPATGRAYLLRRAGAEQLAEQLERSIGSDAIEINRTAGTGGNVAISLAVLVRRDAAESVKSRIPRAANDVRILVNGPWPPYTFADRPRLGTRNASA